MPAAHSTPPSPRCTTPSTTTQSGSSPTPLIPARSRACHPLASPASLTTHPIFLFSSLPFMIRPLRTAPRLYPPKTHCVHEVGASSTAVATKLPSRSAVPLRHRISMLTWPRCQASRPTTDAAPQQNIDQGTTEKSRPHSISSTGSASLTARHSKRATQDAKHVIFDMSAVGTDLGRGTAFVRPAGVDGPADPPKTVHSTKTASGTTDSKLKRARTTGEADKATKKTRLALVE